MVYYCGFMRSYTNYMCASFIQQCLKIGLCMQNHVIRVINVNLLKKVAYVGQPLSRYYTQVLIQQNLTANRQCVGYLILK